MENINRPVYGITQFTRMFSEKNLALFKPKKDQCDICCAFKCGTVGQVEYNEHIRRKTEASESKETDKKMAVLEGRQKVVTMDLQSLLLCPKLNASCLYYKTKLCCHNFTIYDLATGDVACYFWNETAADLNASTFATCIISYLESLDITGVDRVILYSDGCTYQNRNVVLANALLKFSVEHHVVVEQKFLEKGHMYMECDSVHASIERKVKHKDVFVPQPYVNAIESARCKGYTVDYVDHSFYTKLGYYTSIRPGVGVGSPVVTDIRLLKYSPDGLIAYKINYTDESYTDLRKPRNAVNTFDENITRSFSKPLKLKKSKFQHLQQIKHVIPKDYHAFYDALPHE